MARNTSRWRCAAVAIIVLLFNDSHASHTDGDSLPDVTLDTSANELTVFDNASVNVICSSSLSSSSLSWLRVTGSNPMTVDDSSTNLITTNTTRQLTVTISIMDLGDSTSVEYYCTASNDLGVVRSKSLRVRRAKFFGGFSTPSGVVNVTVRTGHAVALHCGVEDSLPAPAIVWLKNGTPVDISLVRYRVLDNAQYLVIYNLMDSDIQMGGVPVNYQCQVTNVNASLTITSPTTYNLIKTDFFANGANGFMIYRRPNNITIFSNTTNADMFTVYFIAAINGDANDINYLQFPSGTINVADLSITYTGAQLEEEATQRDGLIMITLQRQVTPLAGSTTNVFITILDPITILSTVPSGIIRGFTGDTFSFNCTASGTGVQLDWYRNASQLPESSSVLSISNTSLADTGVYQCYWSSSTLNMFRIVTWALVISDPVRPTVTQFLSMPAELETRRTVTNGTGVTLHLTVRADTLPTITWRFRGVAISESNTDYNISSTVEVEQGDGHQYMSILTIHRVTSATSGDYDVVINDGRTDPVITPTQLVSLHRPPSVVSFVPSKGCLLSTSVVSLTCKADGLPTPTITFLKYAADFQCDSIPPTCNISNGVLTFTQPAPTDAGRYRCVASSTFDNIKLTDTSTIDIQYCNVNVYVLPTQSRALQCEVYNVSSAGATSEWFYKNQSSPEIKLMTEPNKYSISNDQLTIMNTIKSDRGRYRCVLMPVGGDPVDGSFTFNYTVLRIPQFRSPRKSVNVTEGDNFTLVYDIFYEEGNAPQLNVGEFKVCEGPSTILTICRNDSTCSPPNNARISASANFTNMAIDVTVTFKGAMVTDANIYPATVSASFSYTTRAYSATITVVVLNSTAVVPVASSSVLMVTPSITSTAPFTSPTNVASSACTTALIGIGVGIPVTFMLTAIISSLLTLLITYLCLTRGKCLKSTSPVPIYDPLSSDTSVEMKSNVYSQKTT